MNRSCVVDDNTPETRPHCVDSTEIYRAHIIIQMRVMRRSGVPGMMSTLIWSEARNHRKWICKFGTNSVSMRNNSLHCCCPRRRIPFVQHLIYIHINLNFIYMLKFHGLYTFLGNSPEQPVADWRRQPAAQVFAQICASHTHAKVNSFSLLFFFLSLVFHSISFGRTNFNGASRISTPWRRPKIM